MPDTVALTLQVSVALHKRLQDAAKRNATAAEVEATNRLISTFGSKGRAPTGRKRGRPRKGYVDRVYDDCLDYLALRETVSVPKGRLSQTVKRLQTKAPFNGRPADLYSRLKLKGNLRKQHIAFPEPGDMWKATFTFCDKGPPVTMSPDMALAVAVIMKFCSEHELPLRWGLDILIEEAEKEAPCLGKK